MENLPLNFDSVFTVDCIIFGFHEGELKILLIERNEEPFKGWFALPGYFVKKTEAIETAAQRILYESTGLKGIYMEQFYTFGALGRHPLGRVITVGYYAMIRLDGQKDHPKPISDFARQAVWMNVKDIPELAFDHSRIFRKGFEKIKNKISYQPIAFELLPEKFTLTQLQSLYEVILNKKLDKRNFRKKMLSYDILKELDEKQKGVSYRAAKLYKFDKRKYARNFHKELSFSR